MPNEDLRESWFGPPSSRRVSRTSGVPAVVVFERSRGATFTLGAILGALGGASALLVAGAVQARRLELHLDVATQLGHAIRNGPNGGFALAALAGFLYGGLLALVMRHAARFFARAIFGVVAGTLGWFCVHLALVAKHYGTLPLVPMIAGAALFGIMIALVPSARRL